VSDHFPPETLQTDLAGLLLVSEPHVLAVDDGLLLAGLAAGAGLHHGLSGRGQGGDQGEPGREVVTAVITGE